MMKRQRALAYLALLSGILCLSFSALFVRWSEAPGVITSFYRMAIASLVLAPWFIKALRAADLSRRQWAIPVLAGTASAFDHALWSTSIGYTRVANATLLNNTAPVWVALIAWLVFRERLPFKFWIGLLLTMTGATIVLGSDLINHPTLGMGDAIAVVSGMFYAAYFLITQRGRKTQDTLVYLGLATLSCAAVLLVISLGLRMPLTGFPPGTYAAFIGAGLISQVAGYYSINYALGHLPASVVAPTMITQPVITALLAIPLVGEALSPAQWIGGIAVLAGVYLVNWRQQAVEEIRAIAVKESSQP